MYFHLFFVMYGVHLCRSTSPRLFISGEWGRPRSKTFTAQYRSIVILVSSSVVGIATHCYCTLFRCMPRPCRLKTKYMYRLCALKLCTAGCEIDDFTSKLVLFCKLRCTPIARVTEGVLCVSVSGVPLQLCVVRFLYHIGFLDQLSIVCEKRFH